MGKYFWVSRRTNNISSLPKFIGFNVAVSLASGALAFGFHDVSPDTFFKVFLYTSIATIAMALVSLVRLLATCDYEEFSEGELEDRERCDEEEKIRNREVSSFIVGELVNILLCCCRKKTGERNIVEIFNEGESTESHVSQVERGKIRNSSGTTTYGSIGYVPIPIPGGYSASASTISSEKDTTTLL